MAEDKQNKQITVKEFKMWLQGVEEMQDDDWTPTAVQWKRIREKINQIADTAPAPTPVTYRGPAEAPAMPFPAPGAAPPMPPSGMSAAPSSLQLPPNMPAAPRTAVTPGGLPVSLASQPGAKVKTPDIDTSNGNYNSQFV